MAEIRIEFVVAAIGKFGGHFLTENIGHSDFRKSALYEKKLFLVTIFNLNNLSKYYIKYGESGILGALSYLPSLN